MDHGNPKGLAHARLSNVERRLVAVGSIRRRAGRTLTVRATAAGVTGTITPTAHGPQADACPLCGDWECTCTPWTGGAR
ncbi:hypothetical protein [Streptomyces tremellae]|uniref:Uncharacterized protein n=1 Tax=Streptomyces tremellae TaxID=1124239 RepID=A0ABP7EYN2_9ACTN